MKAALSGLLFLLLTGCSSMPSDQTGDFNIRTTQMGAEELKILPTRKEPSTVEGRYLKQARIKITNHQGKLLQEHSLRGGNIIIQYPMHESSIVIEVTDNTGNTGTKVFSRIQLRDFSS